MPKKAMNSHTRAGTPRTTWTKAEYDHRIGANLLLDKSIRGAPRTIPATPETTVRIRVSPTACVIARNASPTSAPQYCGQETTNPLVLGVGHDPLGLALFDNRAVDHDDHAIRHVPGELHLVRCD